MKKTIEASEGQQRFLLAVGHVTREWAHLESVLSLVLTQILRTDQFRARIVWASLRTSRARRDLLTVLARTYLDPSRLDEFMSLMSRLKKLGSNRNSLAHHLGGVESGKNTVFLMNDHLDDHSTGAAFLKRDTFQISNVEGWGQAIQQLATDTMNFMSDSKDAWHSLPRANRSS